MSHRAGAEIDNRGRINLTLPAGVSQEPRAVLRSIGPLEADPRAEPRRRCALPGGQTPIGNRGRSLAPGRGRCLKGVESASACEDPATAASCLAGFAIRGRLLSFHQHNQHGRTPELLARCRPAKSLALISDAGLRASPIPARLAGAGPGRAAGCR